MTPPTTNEATLAKLRAQLAAVVNEKPKRRNYRTLAKKLTAAINAIEAKES